MPSPAPCWRGRCVDKGCAGGKAWEVVNTKTASYLSPGSQTKHCPSVSVWPAGHVAADSPADMASTVPQSAACILPTDPISKPTHGDWAIGDC